MNGVVLCLKRRSGEELGKCSRPLRSDSLLEWQPFPTSVTGTRSIPKLKKDSMNFTEKNVIKKGEELLYDYGKRHADVIKANPWIVR